MCSCQQSYQQDVLAGCIISENCHYVLCEPKGSVLLAQEIVPVVLSYQVSGKVLSLGVMCVEAQRTLPVLLRGF